MQALFYLGLFGTIFFMIVSITVGTASSSMQLKLDRLARVDKLFHDTEYAINNLVIDKNGTMQPTPNNTLSFLAEDVGFTKDELTKDPWGSDYTVVRIDQEEVIGSYGVDFPTQHLQSFSRPVLEELHSPQVLTA